MNLHNHASDRSALPWHVAFALLGAVLWLGACSGPAPQPLPTPTPEPATANISPTPTPQMLAPTATRWLPKTPGPTEHPPSTPIPTATRWMPKTPTPQALGPSPTETSAAPSYALDCETGYFRLIDKATGVVIATTYIPASESDCEPYSADEPIGSWTDNGRRVAFFAGSSLYVWTMGERGPQFVYPFSSQTASSDPYAFSDQFGGPYEMRGRLEWSPDGNRVALMTVGDRWVDEYDRLIELMNAWIFDARESDLVRFRASVDFIGWESNDVLCFSCRTCGASLYHARTGRLLYDSDYFFEWGCQTPPSLSPDERWLAVRMPVLGSFWVHDLHHGVETMLSSAPQNDLRYVGWSPDSKVLYLVSRPLTASAQAGPNTPFGLLAYDPTTQKVTMLFDQAVEAYLNPDQQWALVAFPSRQEDGHLALAAGLWNLATGELIAKRILAEKMLYPGDPPGPYDVCTLVDAQWTEDGRKVQLRARGETEEYTLEVPEP